ncbi:MAG: TonB-dependent receptor, partial [Bryobacter sp.]|nr:TonB-dependent receptor [Bryobacter sp.]
MTGVVLDATGAVIPNASVTVLNEPKGIRRTLTTNEAGAFTAPGLVPSDGYEVNVKAAGFAEYQQKAVVLTVGQVLNLVIRLEVSSATTSVQVVELTPLVDSVKQGVSQVVGSQQILNLPINGRRVDSFVLLTPGVVPDGTFGLVSFRGIAGGNAFLTDGNDTTNQFYNENAGRTRITTQISQDAVQEFQVLTNGYAAEFGRASGGVINTVTRSGTNDVHGTAYWFFRNRTLNARDRYATLNPPEWRHQAGGSVGGAIKKDKLFYFFNGELTRRNFGKIDWRPTDRQSLSASFNYLRWVSPNGIQTQAVLSNNNALANNANSTVRTRYARLAWTSIVTNTLVNEARFGWFKDRLFDDFNPDFIPPQTQRLGVSVAGTPVGVAIDYPRLNPSEQRYQFADNATWTVQKHTLKFGFDVTNTQDYLDILRNQFGSFSYANFNAFALDFTGNTAGARNYQTFTQQFGNPILDMTTRDWSFYVQDQWRINTKLTLNGGVRYEYSQLPQPTQVNPNYPQTGVINSPKNNWAPRLGLAYSVNDKTVIRAGAGIFYARFQGALLQTLFFQNGLYQPSIQVTPTTAGAPVFPNRVPSLAGFPGGSVSITFAGPEFRNPYVFQGDIAIERQFGRDWGMTMNYVYSRGVQITTTRDLNIGALGPEVSYRINDASGNQVGTFTTPTYRLANRVDTRYQRLLQVENGGQSWYNGLVLQLNKRFSKGFQMNVAYTWSHAIDTANQGGGSNTLFFDTLRSTYNGDYSADKGSSSLDQRHRMTTNFLWSPTFTKSNSAAAKWLVNGWQLSGIVTLASAQPFTSTLRVVGTPFTGAAFPQTLNGFGGSNRVPFLPFGNVDIDQVYRADMRISRELPFSERFKGYLQFEAFNLTNSVSDTSRLTEAYSMTNGVISPT